MHEAWKIYWQRLFSSLKGFGIAIGVAAVFYLFNILSLKGTEQHVRYFLISLMFGWVIYGWIFLFFSFQWAIVVRRFIKFGTPIKIPFKVQIFLGLSGTTLGIYTSLVLENWIFGIPFTFPQFWQSLCVGMFLCLMFHFYYAYKEYYYETLELKAAKAESDLHVLRNQMQPHFLFNSLNSLAALIEQNQEKAGEVTQNLADLYRLILDCSQTPLSPIKREMKIVSLYLSMEKIRFGERLKLDLQEPRLEWQNILLPSLVLQTLVENAIKHGISKSLEGGLVSIEFNSEQSGLRISVINTGARLPAGQISKFFVSEEDKANNRIQDNEKQNTGLRNTFERLTLAFSNAHGFSIHENKNNQTVASFLVPGT